jgi:tetratricopeptide (TPR) repeat protein
MDPANLSQGYGFLVSYGSTQAELGDLPGAIQAYQRALDFWPDNPERWRVEAAIAQLYAQQGDNQMALYYAQEALASAPEEQRSAVEELIRLYSGQS